MTQRPIRARAERKRFVPGCGACNGTGRVHVQVRGQFRVESRECQCWRVQGAFEQARGERLRQLRRDEP